MIVYMTRKHRRAVRDLISKQFGDDDLPRGSRETLRAALDHLRGAVEWSYCWCDDCTCPERASVEAELELADNFASLLLAAHPRWRLRRTRRAVTPQASWWVSTDPCIPRAHAVQVATRLVSNGEAEMVVAALAVVGCERVSEVSEDDTPAFLAALAP